MHFDDLSRWVRGSALEVVLIALGAMLIARFVRWMAGRLVERATRIEDEDGEDTLVASEASKYRGALVQGSRGRRSRSSTSWQSCWLSTA